MNEAQQAEKTEQQLEQKIRTAVLRAIQNQRLSDEELAEKLGVLPAGVAVLKRRSRWSLGTAIKMAAAMGFSLNLEVIEKSA